MTTKQKRITILGVFASIVISAILTVLPLKYNRQVLPVFDLARPDSLSKAVPQERFSVVVGIDNKIRVETGKILNEEEAKFVNENLGLLFRTFVSGPISQSGEIGLAHQFSHFTIVEFGDQKKPLSLIFVFSREVPRVNVKGDWKLVTWRGERISFDLARGFWTYEKDENSFQFRGEGELRVDVFPSKSLVTTRQPAQKNKLEPKSERL